MELASRTILLPSLLEMTKMKVGKQNMHPRYKNKEYILLCSHSYSNVISDGEICIVSGSKEIMLIFALI